MPYRPLSLCCIARLHEEQLFFQHLQTFITPYSGRILSLFGYTMRRIALPACLPAYSGYNILKRALMLHADFACGKNFI